MVFNKEKKFLLKDLDQIVVRILFICFTKNFKYTPGGFRVSFLYKIIDYDGL